MPARLIADGAYSYGGIFFARLDVH